MSSSSPRLWTPEMVLVEGTLEFDPDQPAFSLNGERIEYPLGQVIEFQCAEIVVSEPDLPHWCGDPRYLRCIGRFLRSGPMKDRFPRGLLQIFLENAGKLFWTQGRINLST